eukprot:2407542-Amphidinium_carterae.1
MQEYRERHGQAPFPVSRHSNKYNAITSNKTSHQNILPNNYYTYTQTHRKNAITTPATHCKTNTNHHVFKLKFMHLCCSGWRTQDPYPRCPAVRDEVDGHAHNQHITRQ